MDGQNRLRSLSLDDLDFPPRFSESPTLIDFAASSESVRENSSLEGNSDNSSECFNCTNCPQPQCSNDAANKRHEVNRLAWKVSNNFDRRSQAARQVALRTAAILQMRKNSTALKVACLENKDKNLKGDCSINADSNTNVEELRIRLSALDLQLQRSNKNAEQQLSSLETSREQHLRLLKELGELETKEYAEDHTQDPVNNDIDMLVSSLPCLSMQGIGSSNSSPKSRKQEKIAGLKRVAKNSSWGRKLGSRLISKTDLISKQHSSKALKISPPIKFALCGPQHFENTEENRNTCPSENEDPPEDEVRTTISKEALDEIEIFTQLISAYFANESLSPYL